MYNNANYSRKIYINANCIIVFRMQYLIEVIEQLIN